MYTYAVSLPRPATMLKCAVHLYRCPKAVGKSRETGSIVNQRVLARAGVEFVREGLSGELATEGPLLQGQDTREGQITWGTSKRHPPTSHGSGHESEGQDVPWGFEIPSISHLGR